MLAQLPWAKPSVVSARCWPPDWASDAPCKDLEPEEADAYFFPERGQSAKWWPRAISQTLVIKYRSHVNLGVLGFGVARASLLPVVGETIFVGRASSAGDAVSRTG